MNSANSWILTVNGGSSSIKFALFEVGDSGGFWKAALNGLDCRRPPSGGKDGPSHLGHLGNGASLAAVRDGKSVDTSMSLTQPLG